MTGTRGGTATAMGWGALMSRWRKVIWSEEMR